MAGPDVASRAGERFRDLRLPADEHAVLRVDGRGFSRLTEASFTKPFDRRFHEHMQAVGRALLAELGGTFAYVASDEVSLLLPRARPFGGRVEKLVSLAAGVASATFTAASGLPAVFDARSWVGADPGAYVRGRQTDTHRCGLGGWCYWTLRQAGLDAREASRRLDGLPVAAQRALLVAHGVDVAALPAWQLRGAGVGFVEEERAGHDPVRNTTVTAVRRRVVVDEALPVGAALARHVNGLVEGQTAGG